MGFYHEYYSLNSIGIEFLHKQFFLKKGQRVEKEMVLQDSRDIFSCFYQKRIPTNI